MKKLVSHLLSAGVFFLILAYVIPFCVSLGAWASDFPSDWEPWYYRVGFFMAIGLSAAIVYTGSKSFLESMLGNMFIRKSLLKSFDHDIFDGDIMKIAEDHSVAKNLTRTESLIAVGKEIQWLLRSNTKKNQDLALAILSSQANKEKLKNELKVERINSESDIYIASSEVYMPTCEDDGLTGRLELGVDHLFFYASDENYRSVILSKVGKDAGYKIAEKFGDNAHPLIGVAVQIASIAISDNKKEFKKNLTNSISVRLADIDHVVVTKNGFIGREKLVEIKVKNSNGISSYSFGTFDEMDQDFSEIWLEKIELACLLCGSIINREIGPKAVAKIEPC
ncbi:hypothetical protein D0C16_17415 [Cellvibrio sp. KY-GH-1]|uniref:hypothetical protein n=1 Tax=Cellvibrio sp. KY-GH-1 TaxID=2303332 RepID=UPI001246B0D3|nr:hypothetical protein [Cellvibrio sp. KY-GH-1]QEY17610.1 hypothetical protein D0C16_17415 [Cellvibrio sp. KY-GH-1]